MTSLFATNVLQQAHYYSDYQLLNTMGSIMKKDLTTNQSVLDDNLELRAVLPRDYACYID